jgi:hypothetical protein
MHYMDFVCVYLYIDFFFFWISKKPISLKNVRHPLVHWEYIRKYLIRKRKASEKVSKSKSHHEGNVKGFFRLHDSN